MTKLEEPVWKPADTQFKILAEDSPKIQLNTT